MKYRLARTNANAVIEILLAALGLHVVILSIFRRYSLEPLGIPVSARSPTLALLLCAFLLALRVWLNRGRSATIPSGWTRLRPGSWASGLGLPGLIVALCFLAVFFVFHHHGGTVGSDGVINFVYLRSVVMDFDLDLTNEFEDFVPAKFQSIAVDARAVGGSPDPSNEPGPALLWAPAYVATHVAVRLANALGAGPDIPADGYSYPYLNAVCSSGFLLGFVAVVVSYRVTRRYFAPWLAAVSVSVAWLTTTLYWYTVMEPSMPHAPGAAAVSVFLYLWLDTRERPTLGRWIALGLVFGLVVSIQRYLAFFFIAPLATGVAWWWSERKKTESTGTGGSVTRPAVLVAVLSAAILVSASPLLLYNLFHAADGSALRIGVNTFRYWSDPKIAEFLFSSNHGLFSWTPVAGLSVVGLLVFLRKDRPVAGILILTLALGVYLLSSTWDWYAGHAFGSRRMTEAFVVFALGFCSFTELVLRRPSVVIAAALLALVGWNLLLVGQVKRGEIPMMGTFSFSESAARATTRLYELTGHPASFPAPWLFGLRYGTRPDQFDPIFGHREYHNLVIDVGAKGDEYFLGHGWSRAETRPDGASFRWSVGEESTWLVPLSGAFDYRLRLSVEPARHPRDARQSLSVEVNGARAAALTLRDGWQVAEALVPSTFWKEGLNEVRLRYGYSVVAGEVYGGNDPRRIAIRADRVELLIEK